MKQRLSILILLIATITLGAWLGQAARPENFQLRGQLTFDPEQVPSADYEVGDFIVKWRTENGGQLTVEAKDRPGFALWQTIPGEAFVMAVQGNETVTENRGMFKITDQYRDTCQEQFIANVGRGRGPDTLEVNGKLVCQSGQAVSYSLMLLAYPPKSALQLNLAAGNNRVYLAYQSTPDEHFFGFGEQFTYFDMQGKYVPIWVSEQGVGRGEQPLTFFANLTNGGAGGNAFTTYAPIPFYITDEMRALYLINGGYTAFDLRKNDRVVIKAFGSGIIANILDGTTPKEIIETYTNLTGRMRHLPDWVHTGAIVGMQGGTEKVRTVLSQLKQRNTPITSFWLQDWVGQRTTSFGKQLWWNWEVNNQRYPAWNGLVNDLNNEGIRMMVYVNPYLVDVTNNPDAQRSLFQEALEAGYLIHTLNGDPYLVLNTDFRYGMVDLTNPDARQWLSKVIQEQVVDAGASGWMADFGESLPYYDAVLQVPNDSALPYIHNRWPVIWSGFNSSIVDQSDNDLVFFSRAAFTGSSQVATLFWEGDQLLTFIKIG